MTRVFVNGKEISKEELKNYTAVFDQTGKRLLRLEKKTGKEEKCEKVS